MFVILLLIGLVLLVVGAELLVRYGGQLALALRVPALIVGLTVVAFGTSCPELAVSVAAALKQSTSMALANVNGSNIANILLVLGAASIVQPLVVDRSLMRREMPALIGLQIAVPIAGFDGVLGRFDGAVLLSLGVLYNVLLIRAALAGRALPSEDTPELEDGSPALKLLLLATGIVVLVGGASLFISGASEVVRHLGVSDRYVGLTVVALGTSAPELVTAMVSAHRGEVELAIGNTVGSNILNIAMVLGITAMIAPIHVTGFDVWRDLGAVLVTTGLLTGAVLGGRTVGRLSGVGACVLYLAYMAFTAS